jgi:hypothetical protein
MPAGMDKKIGPIDIWEEGMIHYFVSVQLNQTRMPSRRCLATAGNAGLAAGTNSSALSGSYNAVMKSLNGRASLRIFLNSRAVSDVLVLATHSFT